MGYTELYLCPETCNLDRISIFKDIKNYILIFLNDFANSHSSIPFKTAYCYLNVLETARNTRIRYVSQEQLSLRIQNDPASLYCLQLYAQIIYNDFYAHVTHVTVRQLTYMHVTLTFDVDMRNESSPESRTKFTNHVPL